MNISIRGGRLIDPANGVDALLDLHIEGDRVARIGDAPAGFEPEQVIDATGRIVCPGLIDLGVRLREPGLEHKASIASECRAAAANGITTLICEPDTDPVIDTPAVWELIRRAAKHVGRARVLAIGALTQDLAGKQLAEMAALQRTGCVALSNAQHPMASTRVQLRALQYASTFGITVLMYPQEDSLAGHGCVHDGAVATRLGLPGIPTAAETVAVARDIALAAHAGARLHLRCLSSASGARMLRDARANQQSVSADVAIHQLHLTEMDVAEFDPYCHVMPPLRTLQDRDALRAAVADGTIQVICSAHQPHERDAKETTFENTAPGISGLDTLLGLTLRLVIEKVLTLNQAIERLTRGPAELLGLDLGHLSAGAQADICVFDPQEEHAALGAKFVSAGHNTPFDGWDLPGRVTHTIYEGRLVYQAGAS